MDSLNPDSTDSISSIRVYVLAVILLGLALLSFIWFFDNPLAYGRGISASAIDSLPFALPFLFIFFVLLFKEKQKMYLLTKTRQEKIALGLSIAVVLMSVIYSLISFYVIGCKGDWCGIGVALKVLFVGAISAQLVLGFSLWFLKVRYQWRKRSFWGVIVVLILLLVIAYFQTPLL